MDAPPRKPKVYVSAFFCEKCLTDDDGVLSAIRLTEQYVVPLLRVYGKDREGKAVMHDIWQPIHFFLVITFRSEAPVKFIVRIESVSAATGEREVMPQYEFEMEGGVSGRNLKVNVNAGPKLSGLAWFEIFVDDELAMKVPAELIRQPLNTKEQFESASATEHSAAE